MFRQLLQGPTADLTKLLGRLFGTTYSIPHTGTGFCMVKMPFMSLQSAMSNH